MPVSIQSGYLPSHTDKSGQQLAECVVRYTFVSSISVYARFVANMDESAAGIVFTTFHFPEQIVNNITSTVVDEETMCPEYK